MYYQASLTLGSRKPYMISTKILIIIRMTEIKSTAPIEIYSNY